MSQVSQTKCSLENFVTSSFTDINKSKDANTALYFVSPCDIEQTKKFLGTRKKFVEWKCKQFSFDLKLYFEYKHDLDGVLSIEKLALNFCIDIFIPKLHSN